MSTYKLSLSLSCVALLCVATTAEASLTILSAVGGGPYTGPGINYVNFDDLPAGVAGGTASTPSGSVTVNITSNAQAVTGDKSGEYAAPYLSGNNGALFGNLVANGPDQSQYLTSGSDTNTAGAAVELLFGSAQQYLGLLWGSVDDYNTLTFYDGATEVGVLTGIDVTNNPNGDQGVNGTYYVNIDSTVPFDRVVATSSAFAFEFDNVAYAEFRVVPEVTSLLVWGAMLIPVGLVVRRSYLRKVQA